MAVPPNTGVQLGSIFMSAYNNAPVDAEGVRWTLTGLDGWDDGWDSGTGTGVQQKSYADGTWVTAQYAGPRLIHVSGSIDTESDVWDDATRAWDRLLAQVPFRGLGTLLVSAGEGTMPERIAAVRQEGKPVFTDRIGGYGKFSLSLLAPDPRKYAAVLQSVSMGLPSSTGGLVWPVTYPVTWSGVTTNSTATVVNEGTWDSPPLLTVTGPCPPCRITNLTTGQSLLVVEAVSAGQTLVIDVANGTATVSSQSRRVLGSWWSLVPGSNTIAFSGDGFDAAALLTVDVRSAWK
ncbi:MAG: hypothetical protein ABIR39_15315 [Nocardioides sp.]|uniref:phage distal tail protein n=1 Tax=Nocardioides sp. TaxID=35761 RepID=UPI003264AA13